MTDSDPIPGEWYEAQDLEFRIDMVKRGEVYLIRWADKQELGEPFRVALAEWREHGSEMQRIEF